MARHGHTRTRTSADAATPQRGKAASPPTREKIPESERDDAYRALARRDADGTGRQRRAATHDRETGPTRAGAPSPPNRRSMRTDRHRRDRVARLGVNADQPIS
jgi:hypothetical protein